MPRTFQARFREALAERQISPAEFARRTGMSRGNVSHWMSGRGRKPTADKAQRAAEELGVNLAWLLREEGPKVQRALGVREPLPVPTLEIAQEVEGVELTKEAIDVARAFMKLPESLRHNYKRSIETEALKWAREVPDDQLTHLAAPKKTVKGTQ